MEFEIIETPRLTLRALTPELYQYIFTNYTAQEISKFFGDPPEKYLEEEYKKFRQGLSMYRKSLKLFQLIDKASGKIIGWCGYHTWYVNHDRAEIGYVMEDDEMKGKGLMGEALEAVLHHGFNVMNLHRVEAMVGINNEPSLKLLNKWGFKKEGHLREHYFIGGVYEDSLVYSLLRSEFAG